MRLTISFLILVLALFSEVSLAVPVKASTSKAVAKAAPASKKVTAKKPTVVKAKTASAKATTKKTAAKKTTAKKATTAKTTAKTATTAKTTAKKATTATTSAKVPAKTPAKSTPPAACAVRTNGKNAPAKTTVKPKTLKKRGIETTQFHATCKNSVPGLTAALAAGATLQNPRIWPNEFTFSGGFYVTPTKNDAVMFGAIFLAEKCKTKGGVSIMTLSFDASDLEPVEITEPGDTAKLQVGSDLLKLGKAIRNQLGLGVTDLDSTFPGKDAVTGAIEAIRGDPNVKKAAFTRITTVAKDQTRILGRFDTFKDADVVKVTAKIGSAQTSLALEAKELGMAPDFPVKAFTQVVLVSDKAMSKLELVKVEDLKALNSCSEGLQEELIAKQLAKLQAAERENGEITQAATEGS